MKQKSGYGGAAHRSSVYVYPIISRILLIMNKEEMNDSHRFQGVLYPDTIMSKIILHLHKSEMCEKVYRNIFKIKT